jgi:hypothetical protein
MTAELTALRDEDVDLGLLGFDEGELDRLPPSDCMSIAKKAAADFGATGAPDE